MERPNDILIEWAEEQYEAIGLRPCSFVPLSRRPHQWTDWTVLKGIPQFQAIIHECLTAIPWDQERPPIGAMLKLVYPFAYDDGWDGLFKDIVKIGFLPLLAYREREVKSWEQTSDEAPASRTTGSPTKRRQWSHMIVPTETDAVVVAAMTGIFTPANP